MLKKRQKISITGQVQGVGFRPAVYRIARSLDLTGIVYNDTKGVTIELQGGEEKITEFVARLQSDEDKPPLAKIQSCQTVDIPLIEAEDDFIIETSDSYGTPLSQVTADMATCRDCLTEMADREDFRYGYPFINCTNCGPRYSIVRTIPYDRPNTTMSVFEMCDKCAAQYTDVADRRFHAQPVACPACGPHICLIDGSGRMIETQTEKVITETAKMLLAGKIVAIKGIGGFHLAVDALNNEAVERLRERKKRDHKPFALMAHSIEKIKEYALVSQSAERLLKSPQSPIVLLPKKENNRIAPSVAEGVDSYGFMLCYAPLHFLLFAQNIDVLVMTSGNISDEPLICKNDMALKKLGDVADAFLMHNREIYRQVDDSIVHVIEDQPVPLRRARGYVPTPIYIRCASRVMRDALDNEKQNMHDARRTTHDETDIFAAGADLKNTFCFAKRNQLICSEHIGDLEDAEVYHHYINSIEHLRKLFDVEPKVIACDLHPGYFSTRYAQSLANKPLCHPEAKPKDLSPGKREILRFAQINKTSIKLIQVQHHWAHIASVLAEHGYDEPVIGLVADGTGYGTDGAIWGCECLIATLEKFERFGHLAYYQLAGANKTSKEAIRPTLSVLKQTYGGTFDLKEFDWLLKRFEDEPDNQSQISNLKSQIIMEQLEKGVNCVETSSLGRVFDAVAAMLGLGSYNHFDAQLPMALEAVVADNIEDYYDFELRSSTDNPLLIELSQMFKQIVSDVQKDKVVGIISAKFHNTLAAAFLEMAKAAGESTKLNTVALSGGVFCNRYLANRLIKLLKKAGFSVLFNRDVPANDGGISLGQAAIAAKITENQMKITSLHG
ncbi:MAG: carbamoyltransferase HypF [Sedimentisphaerales bacterium]|nr:carbamoyltransferase HypF [Sedimentisphaerales bacterium]